MSFGKMQSFIEIYTTTIVKDAEGFVTKEDKLLIRLRAYKEERHGNEAWKNRASFTTATALFRFRKPANIEIKEEQVLVCKNEKYNILSVVDIQEKGMYLEVLAEKITGAKG